MPIPFAIGLPASFSWSTMLRSELQVNLGFLLWIDLHEKKSFVNPMHAVMELAQPFFRRFQAAMDLQWYSTTHHRP
ncbi:hypothetical protein AVEN_215787-1 [Araneus ventricosus]|uniref:Uncharacterized protein n=1 Tax=Araneus ventricosus TaxID=182803 RepID=A0A4Y2UG37_ARAVE|nr:hypothetical protein AVEN_215787-1 [Araneus ventricosus]